MSVDSHITMQSGQAPGDLALKVVFRRVQEESEIYFVAECVELPGCFSQGDTQEEASRNIQDAIQLCLSVLFEDYMKQFVTSQPPDAHDIANASELLVHTTHDVQYAHA